jgi:signal transduction histidine kinase/HPt (histidine-containing phosphotransfer) domain-containing protein/ActR/RegA family two-component response regulator
MPDFLIHVPARPPVRMGQSGPELRIGRAPDQGLVLDDPAVSRSHARLFGQGGRLFFEDLGSRHGSLLNGEAVHAPRPVAGGDALGIGRTWLAVEQLEAGDADPGQAEETLVLPVERLRSWIQADQAGAAFPGWRKALDLLHELSLHMLQDPAPEPFLTDLLHRLFDFLEASRGAILLKSEGGALRLLASCSREQADPGPLSLSPATVEAALGRREALILKEPRTTQPGMGRGTGASATASVMAVPLEHAGEVLGLLYFDASRQRLPFAEDDLRFVASLGNLAAAKLLQLRMAEALRHQESLEGELRAAEREAQAKSELLAHVSHEIRTPMNAVLGFAHVAMGQPQTPKAAESLRRIERAGHALMAILNDILDTSRLEAGKLQLESIPFRLPEVLQELRELLGQKAADKGLLLDVRLDDGTPEVLIGDPLRLGQVLTNLVDNAIKFTERGRIDVHAGVREGAGESLLLGFEVRDTGIGLAPGQAERLFDPYVQAESSTCRKYGGTGLGLSIARRLVELMGGTIGAEGAPGTGSRFRFTARFRPGSPGMLAPAPDSAPGERPAPEGPPVKVLLVEDQPLNRELTQTLLEDAGFVVQAAADGFQAVEKVTRDRFDVVLMDVEMPGMDGFETARRIRGTARGALLPILALTAHGLDEHRTRAAAAGMDGCLLKPLDPARLLEAVGSWAALGRKERPPETRPVVPLPETDELACLLPVMDVATALERLNGRRDLLRRFLGDFLEDPAGPPAIRDAMAQGDRETACRLAHNLKGMAGSLAIDALAQAAGALEAHLRDEPSTGWEALCDGLADIQARLREAFSRLS